MHSRVRAEVCASASKKLAASNVKAVKSFVGFDGFVDNIIDVVDKRQSAMAYDRIATIEALGKKILEAAGQSSNYELVITVEKLGGNGPIMANALAAIGLAVTYVGNLGYPAIHPVFEEMTKRAEVISIANPGFTDALEFSDGKLMLGKHQTLRDVSWDNLVGRMGKDKLMSTMAEADLIGMVNWTMLPFMTDIWKHMLKDILPSLPKKEKSERRMFIDLADPEKRTLEDLTGAMNTISQFQKYCHVILGLNLKEAIQVYDALGFPKTPDPEAAIEPIASAIRTKLDIGTVVIHPRRGAAAANVHESASFSGPFVKEPKISTGAGDHFNAGFVTGQLLGLNLVESLCAGTATSGYYVRNAQSPSVAQLAAFVENLPDPQ